MVLISPEIEMARVEWRVTLQHRSKVLMIKENRVVFS